MEKKYYEAFLNNIEQNILNLESINEPKIKRSKQSKC